MSTINEVLSSSPIFKIIDAEDIEKIGSLFEKWEIQPGDVLTTACEPSHHFFILDTGSVLLGMEGGKAVILNKPGDFIAMELLSAKGIYKTTVSVLENGSVFVIKRTDFIDIIQHDTPAAEKIMGAWQDYLDQTAPFAKKIHDTDMCECF